MRANLSKKPGPIKGRAESDSELTKETIAIPKFVAYTPPGSMWQRRNNTSVTRGRFRRDLAYALPTRTGLALASGMSARGIAPPP